MLQFINFIFLSRVRIRNQETAKFIILEVLVRLLRKVFGMSRYYTTQFSKVFLFVLFVVDCKVFCECILLYSFLFYAREYYSFSLPLSISWPVLKKSVSVSEMYHFQDKKNTSFPVINTIFKKTACLFP